MPRDKTSSAEPSLRVKGVPITGRLVGAVLITAIAVWFIAVNTTTVHVKLWVQSVTAPLWLVLAVTLLVGALIGWLVGRRDPKRRRGAHR